MSILIIKYSNLFNQFQSVRMVLTYLYLVYFLFISCQVTVCWFLVCVFLHNFFYFSWKTKNYIVTYFVYSPLILVWSRPINKIGCNSINLIELNVNQRIYWIEEWNVLDFNGIWLPAFECLIIILMQPWTFLSFAEILVLN